MKLAKTDAGIVFVGLSLATLAGCSDGTSASAPSSPPTYHADIAPLIAAKCGSCHTEGGIAPFALSNYAQVSAMKGAIDASVRAKTMPPWSPSADCNDFQGDRSLTDAQIDTISSWVAAGAPEGDPAAKPAVVDNDALSLSRVDLELPMPVAYTPVTSPDEYRCFFIDWPNADLTYVTGVGVEPGYKPIVHHVIAYLATPDTVADFQALDDADSSPGWPCFGGPGGGGSGARTGWIGAWVPGSVGFDFPEGTGIEIPPGSKIIVQMHYNTLAAEAAPDQTKLLLRTDKTVAKRAALVPFTDISWIQNKTMDIPAHTNDVTHEVSADLTKFIGFITSGAIPANVPLTIYQSALHMHTLGKSATTRLERADGTNACLLDIPSWDFHWQGAYTFEKPIAMDPGDSISIRCTWDNPTAADVNWGEGTGDEMCLGTYYITE